ncbi:MAG: hypothetical protein WBQ23_04570 [Bacteroidota bacterium]
MSDIVLLDTSVYLNVLDVPGFNQDRDAIFDQFNYRIENGDYFLLPMATIWETGNHIADIESGGYRRKWAELLYSDVNKALTGNTPYKATYFPERSVFLTWLADFPDFAQRNKTDRHTREGVSLSDLSIIKEWEQTRDRHNMSRVLIWSLDHDLMSYDTGDR